MRLLHFKIPPSQHTLVITDSLSGFKPVDSIAHADIWCFPPQLKLAEEYISDFKLIHSHTSGQYTGLDFQFKSPSVTQTSESKNPHDTAHNTLEVVEWNQGHFLDAGEGSEGQAKAQIYMDGIRQHGIRATGFGHIRGIQTAHSFVLHNHSSENCNREWIVRGTRYELSDVAQETGTNAQFEVKCHFEVSPSNEQIRPDRVHQKPMAKTQTATVVGPADKELWVDELGRVKIQFHWDRYGTNDENSSCWVRVSAPWQGTNFGGVHHPRVNQEVVVDFLSSDGDMPYVSGRLANPNNMPMYELPSQNALSGFQSKEIDGAQKNSLVMDDTPKSVQVMLSSDHELSQLNLGHITRINHVTGRADYRGQGFEARTDAWGAIRAAKGMMLTTYARANGAGHLKDMGETIGILKGAHSQHYAFAELAIDHKADERNIDDTALKQLANQNNEVAGEANSESISKLAALKAKLSATTESPATGFKSVIKDANWQRAKAEHDKLETEQCKNPSDDQFHELKAPHLVLSSPAGIELATPKSTHIATNEHTAITSGGDVSLSVGKRLAASVAKGISMFTQSLGIKLFAAKGKVEIQAQSDAMDIIAEKVFRIISAKGSIEFAAAKEILLSAKGSYIRINSAGIEHGTPANWLAYAGSHGLPGPKSLDMTLPNSPKNYDKQFVFKDENGVPHANQKYVIWKETGEKIMGVTDGEGKTQMIHAPVAEEYTAHLILKVKP